VQNFKLVTSQVGIIKSWQTHSGTNILYPAFTTTEGKERGGCFPAVPVFGAVPNTHAWQRATLAKHGLIRLVNESYPVVSDHDADNRYRTFTMSFPARESYPWSFTVSNRLCVSLSGQNLDYWITVRRAEECETKQQMPLSFGLHPYFPTNGFGWEVIERGRTLIHSQDVVEPSVSFNLSDEEVYLRMHGAVYRLTLRNYDQITIWSDQTSKYICVEPTRGRREEIVLRPGEGHSARCNIEYLPKPV